MPVIEVDHAVKEFRLGTLTSLRQTVLNTGSRLLGRPVQQRPLFRALDDVSFSIEQGEVVGIVGHNGAGKSTLLKLLARISTPTSGAVRVRGRIAPLIEVGAGFVQDFTGRENIYLNGSILGMRRREIDRKFDEIVDFAEMAEFIDTPVKRYSSGMQVKLAFAVATSIESEILIVDEVLAVGDLAFQRKCFDRVESMIKDQGRTVLLVSHNIRQVERLCERVLFMDHGRLIQDGPAADVCNAFYEYSDRRIVASAASRQVRATTGEVELKVFEVLDPHGRPCREVDHGADVKIRVVLQAHGPVRQPILAVGVHTTDFVNVTTATSGEQFRGATLAPGEHEFVVEIKNFPLTPGAYSFRLALDVEDPVRHILYCDRLHPFSVRSQALVRSNLDLEGFFFMATEWVRQPAVSTADIAGVVADQQPVGMA